MVFGCNGASKFHPGDALLETKSPHHKAAILQYSNTPLLRHPITPLLHLSVVSPTHSPRITSVLLLW
jgi:hypothetical protein